MPNVLLDFILINVYALKIISEIQQSNVIHVCFVYQNTLVIQFCKLFNFIFSIEMDDQVSAEDCLGGYWVPQPATLKTSGFQLVTFTYDFGFDLQLREGSEKKKKKITGKNQYMGGGSIWKAIFQ